MTSLAIPSSRRRRTYRRQPVRRRTSRPWTRRGRTGGFWRAARRATYTDQLRARVGTVAGNAVLRGWNRMNRHRPNRQAAIRGSWTNPWGTGPSRRGGRRTGPQRGRTAGPRSGGTPVRNPFRRRPATTTGTTVTPSGIKVVGGTVVNVKGGGAQNPQPVGGQRPQPVQPGQVIPNSQGGWNGPGVKTTKAGGSNVAFGGPHVTPSKRPPKRPWGTQSVTSSGVSGPGNGGAGLGPGAYGTGGAAGDDGNMISPGSAGGSATGGAPNTTGGAIGAGGAPAGGRTAPNPRRGPNGRIGNEPVPSNGGTGVMAGGTGAGGGGLDKLGQNPETDADHAQTMNDIAQELADIAERMRQHAETLVSETNIADDCTASVDEAADDISEAAEKIRNHVQDYMSKYQGVRETAEQTGGKIPGMDPNNSYWSEQAS